MRHPPYHLRVNKAVDRAALVEAIGILTDGKALSEYTYCGMGGPFLEEHRLLYAMYPRLKLVSIEQDEETYKRQKFHRPCSAEILDLRYQEFRSFLRTYESRDEKSIVWADYTDLKYDHIASFIALLGRLAIGSMVKITLRAEPTPHSSDDDSRAKFRKKFGAVLRGSATIPSRALEFAGMLHGMMHAAAQKALRGIADTELGAALLRRRLFHLFMGVFARGRSLFGSFCAGTAPRTAPTGLFRAASPA